MPPGGPYRGFAGRRPSSPTSARTAIRSPARRRTCRCPARRRRRPPAGRERRRGTPRGTRPPRNRSTGWSSLAVNFARHWSAGRVQRVVTSRPKLVSRGGRDCRPWPNTMAVACGSQMAFHSPPMAVKNRPHISTRCRSRPGNSGSAANSRARLVSGPMASSVTSPGWRGSSVAGTRWPCWAGSRSSEPTAPAPRPAGPDPAAWAPATPG